MKNENKIFHQIIIQPKEDIQTYRDKKQSNIENREPATTATTSAQNFVAEMSEAIADNQTQFSLNRILKRKFTELEEITERLRARLLDVTDEADDCDKDNDIDDEFETDLNTQPDEDCDDWTFDDNESGDSTFNWAQFCNAPSALTAESFANGTAQDNIQLIAEALGNSELTEKASTEATMIVTQSHEAAPQNKYY